MRRQVQIAAIVLVTGLAVAQLVRPNTANPPVNPARSLWNDRSVDPQVATILRAACADCHSHETEWPWYSKISPFSWLVANHVKKGRAKLNFSDWSTPSPDQLEEIYDSIAKNKMPMSSYLVMHPKARLSKSSREALLSWADGKKSGSLR